MFQGKHTVLGPQRQKIVHFDFGVQNVLYEPYVQNVHPFLQIVHLLRCVLLHCAISTMCTLINFNFVFNLFAVCLAFKSAGLTPIYVPETSCQTHDLYVLQELYELFLHTLLYVVRSDARLRREVRHLQFQVQRTLPCTSRTTCTTFLFTKKYANFDLDLQNIRNVQIFTKFTKNN